MPDCPLCGRTMDPGFLGTERVFNEVSWFKEKSTLGLGGENLRIPDKLGMIYIEGFICKKCKYIQLKYEQKS